MRYMVRVLCRPEIASGFALAALPTIEATTPEEAARRLADLGADPTIGVILVEGAFYDALPEATLRAIGRRALPMLVPFPSPTWVDAESTADAYIVEMLRQAIGYSVRLR